MNLYDYYFQYGFIVLAVILEFVWLALKTQRIRNAKGDRAEERKITRKFTRIHHAMISVYAFVLVWMFFAGNPFSSSPGQMKPAEEFPPSRTDSILQQYQEELRNQEVPTKPNQ